MRHKPVGSVMSVTGCLVRTLMNDDRQPMPNKSTQNTVNTP